MPVGLSITPRCGLIFCLLAMASLTGCMAPYDYQARQETEQREDYLLMMEKVRRLEGTIEGLDMQIEALNRELENVRRGAERGARSEADALQGSVSSLESRINTLEAARERDRQELVDSLSRKMADLLKQRPALAVAL